MEKTLQVQLQIRQNAEEISSALKDISSWEKSIKNKDKVVQKNSSASIRTNQPRSGGGTVPLKTTAVRPGGYSHGGSSSSTDSSAVTPATIVQLTSTSGVAVPNGFVPKPLGVFRERDLEEIERERGNLDFKNGNFTAAIQCYTRCLGLKKQNYLAFSNRAMAYLKMKEYHRALMDCNSALTIEPTHGKSLLRRATAYNALGRHRAALRDLLKTVDFEPSNKQAKVDLQHTRELLRNAVNMAPMIGAMFVDVDGMKIGLEEEEVIAVQGPDLPSSSSVEEGMQPTLPGQDQSDDFHRISIIEESDDLQIVDVQDNRAEVHKMSSSLPTATTTKTKSNKSPTKVKSIKKTNNPAPIKGTYELEKALLAASSEQAKVTLLQTLTMKQTAKLLQGTMEPDVLYLLLRTILDVFRYKQLNIKETLQWLECIGTISNFSLLFSLLPDVQKEEIQRLIAHVVEESGGSESTRSASVMSLYV